MKRKYLEDLGLEKEVIDKILDENSADIGKVKAELDSTKADLETANKTLEDIKKTNEGNEDLQKQLDDYKAKYEKSEAERTNIIRNGVLKEALKEAGADDVDYMMYKLGEVEFDKDNKAIDLENKIKSLSEANPNHFKASDADEKNDTDSNNGFEIIDTKLTKGNKPDELDAVQAEVDQAMGLNQSTTQETK